MRLEIYEPVEDEKVVRLRLVQDEDRVLLVAYDNNGEELSQGQIAIISRNGIHRCSDFGEDIGFGMDGDRIRDY